jgi:hypothetical protein
MKEKIVGFKSLKNKVNLRKMGEVERSAGSGLK